MTDNNETEEIDRAETQRCAILTHQREKSGIGQAGRDDLVHESMNEMTFEVDPTTDNHCRESIDHLKASNCEEDIGRSSSRYEAKLVIPASTLLMEKSLSSGIGQDDEEPVVEYNRVHLTNRIELTPTSVIDVICAAAVSAKFLAIGFNSGNICVLSHSGCFLLNYSHHQSPVTALSFDSISGSYLGSCSQDGKIFVQFLQSNKSSTIQSSTTELESSHSPSPCTIAIHPQFGDGSEQNRIIVVGGTSGQVCLYTRLAFYTTIKLLHSGEGTIACALWHPSLPILSWTNDKGVKVLETETSQRISFIPNPSESIFDSLDPNIVWINNELLLISWKTIIKIAALRKRDVKNHSKSSNRSSWYIELLHRFSLPRIVCGAAAFDGSGLLLNSNNPTNASQTSQFISVLRYLPNQEVPNQEVPNQEIPNQEVPNTNKIYGSSNQPIAIHHVIRLDGEIFVSDGLPLQTPVDPSRLRLVSCGLNAPSYAVSESEILQIKSLAVEDRVAWLVSAGQFNDAIRSATNFGDSELIQGTARVCLVRLLDSQSFVQATELVQQLGICSNFDLFQDCIDIFDQRNSLHHLIPILPLPPLQSIDPLSTRLSSVCTEILVRLSRCNPAALRELTNRWQYRLSSLQLESLIDSIRNSLGQLSTTLPEVLNGLNLNRRLLLETLGILLEETDMIIESFEVLLLTNSSSSIFYLLEKHLLNNEQLQDTFTERLLTLFEIDPRRTVELLMTLTSETQLLFPVSCVSTVLQQRRKFLHQYLKAVFQKNPSWCQAFHTQQVALFAEFEPNELLDFLQQLHRSGDSFNLSYALAVCRRRQAQIQFCPSSDSIGRPLDEVATSQDESETDKDLTVSGVKENLRDGEDKGAILGLYGAEVYLLCHLGRHREALDVLVNKLGDITAGLQFVISSGDPSLWNSLIDWLIDSPEHLEILLSNIDSNHLTCNHYWFLSRPNEQFANNLMLPLAPIQILQRLPRDSLQRIPDIGSKLQKLSLEISDYETLLDLTIETTYDDYESLGSNFVPLKGIGVAVNVAPGAGTLTEQTYNFSLALKRIFRQHLSKSESQQESISLQTFSAETICNGWLGFLAKISEEISIPTPPVGNPPENGQSAETVFPTLSETTPSESISSFVSSTAAVFRTMSQKPSQQQEGPSSKPSEDIFASVLGEDFSRCILCGQAIVDFPQLIELDLHRRMLFSQIFCADGQLPNAVSLARKLQVFKCNHVVHAICQLAEERAVSLTSPKSVSLAQCLICTKRFGA